MKRSSKESVFRLYEPVSSQQGFFTTKQAIQAGYPDAVHPYHVRNKDWVRIQRGIYRLSRYPAPNRPELMIWYLWSRNREEEPQGIYSYLTALEIHGILPARPDQLYALKNRPELKVFLSADVSREKQAFGKSQEPAREKTNMSWAVWNNE
ncbi:MAG: hypothetical protein GKR87_09605 [Kiritimatiellae bacterium]|nr:hypothetical protein [Kiritimatiellia bacterium]